MPKPPNKVSVDLLWLKAMVRHLRPSVQAARDAAQAKTLQRSKERASDSISGIDNVITYMEDKIYEHDPDWTGV